MFPWQWKLWFKIDLKCPFWFANVSITKACIFMKSHIFAHVIVVNFHTNFGEDIWTTFWVIDQMSCFVWQPFCFAMAAMLFLGIRSNAIPINLRSQWTFTKNLVTISKKLFELLIGCRLKRPHQASHRFHSKTICPPPSRGHTVKPLIIRCH